MLTFDNGFTPYIPKKNQSPAVIFSNTNESEILPFVEAVKKYARTDNDEPVEFNNCLEEYASLIGNLKQHETLTSGCAQNSKSLLNMLFHIYLVIELGYNSIWVFSQERVLNNMVAIQFKPMINYWLANKGTTNLGKGTKNNKLYQVGKANCIFSYASTSKNTGSRNTAAGNAMVSFQADAAFYEEYSQWEAGTEAPVEQRMGRTRIATKPKRKLGTPGADGTGITLDAETCDHHFEPHAICPHCGHEIRLNPEGTLLNELVREKPNGEKVISFTGANGRPLFWFYRDENDKVLTAYFGCPECEQEIPKQTRIHDSYFKCIHTGETLKDYLIWLDSENYDVNYHRKAFIYLSPLLKDTEYNLAANIIDTGLTTGNPEDWYQQQLGLASKTEVTKLTKQIIKRAVDMPRRVFEFPSWTVAKCEKRRL